MMARRRESVLWPGLSDVVMGVGVAVDMVGVTSIWVVGGVAVDRTTAGGSRCQDNAPQRTRAAGQLPLHEPLAF